MSWRTRRRTFMYRYCNVRATSRRSCTTSSLSVFRFARKMVNSRFSSRMLFSVNAAPALKSVYDSPSHSNKKRLMTTKTQEISARSSSNRLTLKIWALKIDFCWSQAREFWNWSVLTTRSSCDIRETVRNHRLNSVFTKTSMKFYKSIKPVDSQFKQGLQQPWQRWPAMRQSLHTLWCQVETSMVISQISRLSKKRKSQAARFPTSSNQLKCDAWRL